MRFTIPLVLLFASLAIAAPAAEADNDADIAVADEEPAPVDVQACRKGYRQCLDNCNRHHGGNKCYRACYVHYCQ
ncbi:uncharacterized protein BO80DRAFT_467645 [Aspergillus ibericus CBS 121593]|uniref:Invertebrate defensins family profile domain-containing protein n=1 Tax=Aspergillus ibericus CBS 121593 TaxID=1448316 RepID=A0A395GQ12_9EURO|nr:hypothetical protein BO80DRAFT_467645 [Aspergillus ibericus CBS 121593]RAK97601.1 hypothetical protein BO80DRAFT_467645 [Aspergillus ibericus CBS 121593]